MTVNVLLTGAAGNQAYFIWKALLHSRLNIRVVGCNYDHNAVGLFQFDSGRVVPAATDPDYISRVIDLCRAERIHIVMVGNMTEMRILAKHKDLIKEQSNAFVVTSPYETLCRLEDKWELTTFLAERGLAFPHSVLPSDKDGLRRFLAEVPPPYVVKDRFGAGSRQVAVARNLTQMNYLIRTMANPLIQEYLFPDHEEYTVGVFVCSDGKPAASIVMRRELNLGMTWKAQVLPDSDIGTYCEAALQNSGSVGPVNLQLRLTQKGPVIFEINPRFSSTTSARPLFGYNEAEMCIRHFVMKETISRPSLRPGRLFRVVEEVVVDNDRFELLSKEGRIENR